MFEKASRMKLRFPYRGALNTEDLWDLSVEALDSIFKQFNQRAKLAQEESLLATKSEEDEVLFLQIAIVKHVVTVKLAEREAREAMVANAARKQKLLALLEEKQDETLKDMTPEQLQAMIDALG